MLSTLHQGLVWAFADDPELGFDLMREIFAIDVPALTSIRNCRSELDRFVPCFGDTSEIRPDLALSGDLVKPKRGVRGAALAIEVLRNPSEIKRWRLWVYWALLAEQLGRPAAVMLVAMNDRVARWGRRIDQLELRPQERLLVLSRQNMPRIIEPKVARRRPSKVLVSGLLHAPQEDMQVLATAMSASLELDDDRRWRYASALMSATPESRRQELKEQFSMQKRYILTQVERNSIAFHDGKREGILEGRREGEHKGKIAGKREGLVDLVLTILELRGIPVDDAARAQIAGCKSLDRLERWAARARQIRAVDELFVR
jgi:hypothetical protein